MTGPRRVLIDADYTASGIWWCLTKEEMERPVAPGRWMARKPEPERPRPWSDRLTTDLLDDLKRWNDDCMADRPDRQLLEQRGRDLAVRVAGELGTDGWEVLYRLGSRVHRVHPPGSWPAASWKQDLLGYAPRTPEPGE